MSTYQDNDLFPEEDTAIATRPVEKEDEEEETSSNENESDGECQDDPPTPTTEEEEEEAEEEKPKKEIIKRKRKAPVKRTITGDIAVTTPKKRRWRSGTQAIREIRRLQTQTDTLIPRSHIDAVVRELVAERANHPLKMQASAIKALHEAGEIFSVELFEESLLMMIHAKRVELNIRDVKLAARNLFKSITKNTFRPC